MKKFTFIIAAIVIMAFVAQPVKVMGQNDYSTNYSNGTGITITAKGSGAANNCTIIINNENYTGGAKAGSSSSVGSIEVKVPANTKYLHLHIAGWKGKTTTLSVTPSGYSSNISITANDGVSGNPPFTFSGDPSTTNYYKVITFTDALTTETTLTFAPSATTGDHRFVIWGVNAEAAGSSTDPSISGTAPAELGYTASSGSFTYTLDAQGTTGTVTATVPSGSWISNLAANNGTVSFDYEANPNYLARTETVTLTYTYNTNQTKTTTVTVTQNGNPNGNGSEADPFTVAEARAFIDGLNGGTSEEVYVTGIVSEIVTAYGHNGYSNITFNMVDNSGDTDFLQAFRCTGTDAANVAVDDFAVVKGNLKLYTSGSTSTYEFNTGCQLVSLTHPTAAVEAPTFSPAAGTYADAQSVTLDCETSGATIRYTTDGTDPTNTSTAYTGAITVSTTTTIKAIAIKDTDESSVATATYHINSAATPYTVAQVMAMPAYQLPANNVYVNGIVSQGGSNLNSGALTYYISVDGATTTQQLVVYKGKGLNNANFSATTDIQVGDMVSVCGNVVDYVSGGTTTREFASGNHLTSFTRPAITTEANSISAPVAGTSGTLNVTYTEIDTDLVAISWFDDPEGTTAASGAPTWVTSASINASSHNVEYVIAENNTASDRSAYFRVHGLSNIAGVDVYSDVVTITQAAPVVPVINADDVNIAFGDESGEIAYTIENGSGTVTAAITGGNTGGWLTLSSSTSSTVPFTCSQNTGAARTAEVTLSLSGAADKVVTITQAAYSTEYNGQGTFTKVTTLADLEDGGYYVIYSTKAMNSTLSSGAMGATAITPANGTIVNPDVSIVWKLEAAANSKWNLYSEDIDEYCFISGNNTTSFATGNTSTYSYTITVNNDGGFTFASTHTNGRCISLSTDGNSFRSFAASNSPTVELYKLGEASQDPTITLANASVAASADNCTMAITYQNMTISGMEDFTVVLCDAEGNAVQSSWITEALVAEENGDYMVSCTFNANTGNERTAYLKVVAGQTPSNVASLTQAAPAKTYTLATTIENGRHYIITNGSNKAMGAQGNNNRPAVTVDITDDVATVTDNDVYEVVINGPDANSVYTIYDANNSGYLYAAGSGDNKRLKTQNFNDDNGKWTIEIDSEGVATIIAQGSNTNNNMRYNSQSTLFSCYASGQQDIYLFMKDETTPQYDFYKDVAAWSSNASDNWYFIASPLASAYSLTGTDMVSGTYEDYDLYRLNNTTWENYNNSEHSDFNALNNGTGYLYANSQDVTLHFSGAINEFTTTGGANKKSLSEGWNLIGNPYSIPIYINKTYYKMNADGTDVETEDGITSIAIPAGTGVVVKATSANETVTFSTTAPSKSTNNGNLTMTLAQTVATRGNSSTAKIDNAIVSFNEDSQLEKFYFGTQNANLYIPQGSEEYAIVSAEAQGEMPVNFKANEDGQYTISVNAENVEMNYLHLIDNLTGADVDLLNTPNYTFNAKNDDYESRFRLVFSANNANTENGNEDFAFISNGQIIINDNLSNATLQTVDMLGRVVNTQQVNGNTASMAPVANGVYVLRLINGNDVKTQKIVVR